LFALQSEAETTKIMQPQTTSQGATNALKEFENFMFSRGQGWTLVNRQGDLLTYQKSVPFQRGSCLVAAILFLIMILPGILYLYFSRKDAVVHQLLVRMDASGNLSASGDNEGLAMYNSFLRRNQPNPIMQMAGKLMPKKK